MTQYGVWVTNKPVPFQRHRLSMAADVQEGVVAAGDYKATQRGAGANMSVDVAIGQAFVAVDSGARNGLGFVYSDALENIAVGASDATNPRLDQLVLQWNDSSIPAGVGGDTPTLRVVAGVPTAGATLDTRNGAAALPADAVRLADILVPAASTSVVTANIRDRRPWARGLYQRQTVTTGDVSTTSTVYAAISPSLRVECSGAPLRITARVGLRHSVGSAFVLLIPHVDGVTVDGITTAAFWQRIMASVASTTAKVVESHDSIPAAGSHLVELGMATVTAGTMTANASNASNPTILTVEELVRQTADNT